MSMRLAIYALAGLALGSCATTGSPMRSTAAQMQSERYNADYDAAKVAAVTRWAEVRGATVVWVHYPRKKSDGT